MADNNTVEVIKSIGEIVTPVAIAFIAYLQIKQGKKQNIIHKEMNGMKSELVEAVRGRAQSEGELKGAADNQAITDAKSQDKK